MMFGSLQTCLAARTQSSQTMQPLVQQINAREADFTGLDDDALRKCLPISDKNSRWRA